MRRLMACALLVMTATAAEAATVHGKVVHRDGNPGARAKVALMNAAGSDLGAAYAASDGVYYLYNVQPGAYRVQVMDGDRVLARESVSVGSEPVVEVPPLLIP